MELVSQAIEPGDINGSAEAKPLLHPYVRLAGHLPSISAGTVLAGDVPQELLQGRIIVVGATASGLASRYSMPMGTVMPGIKIQAHLLQGLLDKQMIAKAGIFACLTIALIPLWLFMVSMGLFPRIPSLLCLAVLTAVVMVCAAGALILFRIWIDRKSTRLNSSH